jgi:hypothetical protein
MARLSRFFGLAGLVGLIVTSVVAQQSDPIPLSIRKHVTRNRRHQHPEENELRRCVRDPFDTHNCST